jgi:hypothetical protein
MIRKLLFFLTLTASLAQAQVSYTGGAYSQNFDTLPGTTNNTLNTAWTDNSTLSGWYANKTTFSVTDGTVGGTAAAFSPTAAANTNNVGLFSFGTAASTDRALGSRATAAVAGNNPVLYGARLVNNTTQTLTNFTVTYTGEQWHKTGKTTADTLLVDYQLGATTITAGTWVNASAGTFTSPINTATIATLPGNTAANRKGLAVKVTGVSWAPGAELWVRFRDADDTGDEQSLAVDDFSFVADNESGIYLNGSTSYVSMGFGATAASLNASNFTIECRFMRTGPGVTASTGTGGITTAVPLVAKGVGEADGTNVDANYFLGIDNVTGKLVADFEQLNATNDGTARAAGLNFPIMGSTVIQNGVFYHVAASYDTVTATWKLYVNGIAETTVLPSGAVAAFVGVVPRSDNIQGLGIGTTINSTGLRSGFFHGIIDEARIWNIVRTPAEILANKDVKIAAGTTGLLGRYGFDEATGTTAAGINAAGGAAPVGTLSGSPLPVWVNSKSFVPNIAPTVSITAPATGSSVMFPAAINIAADASDSDGSIAKVEFFNGATKIGEDLTAPYNLAWTGVVVGGPYSLTAVATDNGGGTATSSAVTVSVTPNSNQPPVVTLAGPADNATGIGSSTSLNLSIADNEGDAQTVSFFGRRTTPVAPGPDFGFIAIPDTQYYSENTARNPSATGNAAIDTGATAALFHAQTQWIVDNRVSRNIAFVSHMGDIAQNGDAFESEWIVANAATARIENPATTFLAHGIPWGVAPGNHDQMPVADAGGVANFYTKYFNFTRWDNRPYYGGHFGTKPIVSGGAQFPANTNNYQLFSASGMDFIIIHMEYDARAKSFYQGVLDWADALLKAYPDRRAIVTSHWILNTGNPASFSTQGQAIYDDLKDNPNLFLLLCGHVNGEGRRADSFNGRTVYSILSDYQESKNGGNGFLRALTFKPSTNQIHVESYSPTLNRAVDATDGVPAWSTAYDLNYNMQSAVTDWIPLGSVNVAAAGTTANLAWTGLEAGKDFEWYATVNDSINTVTTTTRRFSTTAPVAPTVGLTNPADGSSVGLNTSINLTATASDTDGTITRVEFFDGGTKLGESTAAPYAFAWNGAVPGVHTLTAVATDNSGLDAVSSVVTLTISNIAPTVVLTEPDELESFYDAPTNLFLSANASDADGTIAKVEFYANATKIGEALVAPYQFTWTRGVTGVYSVTAKAIDNYGASTISYSALVTVTNVDNVAPTAGITSPSNGGAYAVGSAITINATTSDTDGVVAKVEFYQGTTKLGEDLSSPFSFAWSGATVGSYTLTAVATDNDGAVTTSSAVSITVASAGSRSFVTSIAENFDSMGTGTAFALGWSIKTGNVGSLNTTWTDAIAINGTGTNSVAVMLATTGVLTLNDAPSANNVNGYNAMGATTTDRVLATAPTGVNGVAIQLQLTNNSPAAIGTVQLGYDIRRYTAVATANELPGYWLFYSLDNVTTWTNVSALNPTLAGAGVQVPNTIGVTTVAPAAITLSSAWAMNADLLLRWVDDNAVATSPDQIIGLDNFTITSQALVGTPPTVTLTAPLASDPFFAPATINLAATAADTDGTIAKVEFYNGATKLGEATSAPYTYAWTSVASGTYSLTARATDNDNNITASSSVYVVVNPAPGSGTLTRGAYLNQNNQNSIVVRWRSSQAVAGRVMYGTSPTSLTSVANEAASATDHVVRLTGLAPYTRYYYSIGSAYDTLAGGNTNYTFRTSPVPGTATDTRIWVVGDCGRGTQFQMDVRDAYYSWTGSRTPDMCLMLGDNAYNSGLDTEYTTGFYNIYPTMFRKMPLWSCLGNHDANNGVTTPTTNFPYFDMFTFPTAGECGGVASGTEHYFSWDYGNIHFISLDSQTTLANSSPTAPQTVWLQQDLASTTKTWIIAFFHHPPYSKGSHDSDTEAQMVTMRQIYNPIMEAGGVDLVLVGHSHAYERSMLVDGHYGVSTTLTNAMKKNAGSGRTTGAGAYLKPLTGPRDHFGTVYTVTGSAGSADGGSLNHPVMYVSYNTGGTFNIDVSGNRLDATYVEKGATSGAFNASDNFTMIKQGAADSDGDGVSDEFEIAHGMNRFNAGDASQHLDGSGFIAKEQYLLGLTPGTTQRYAWTTTKNPSTDNIDVSFPTLPQRTYQVFWSSDLSSWNPASIVVNGDGTTKVWTDDGTSTGTLPSANWQRFYRVQVSNGP